MHHDLVRYLKLEVSEVKPEWYRRRMISQIGSFGGKNIIFLEAVQTAEMHES